MRSNRYCSILGSRAADLAFLSDLLSTASRDGTIRVWDRRVTGYAGTWPGEGEPVGMVNMIKNAHASKGKPGKSVRPSDDSPCGICARIS